MTSRELFEKAIETVLENEGDTFTDLPNDRGGPTKYGISQRFNSDVDVKNLSRSQAIEIYWARYWEGQRFELLPEPIAIKVFDLAVNLGKRVAVTCLQRALRSAGIKVQIDGRIGPQTAEAAKVAHQAALMAALRSEAAGEYRLRVARNGDQAIFEGGWLNRAYA